MRLWDVRLLYGLDFYLPPVRRWCKGNAFARPKPTLDARWWRSSLDSGGIAHIDTVLAMGHVEDHS